jgi:uncharacterized RDD family membrane protein YckC
MVQEAELREAIDTTAEVETPEHVRFHHRIAGPAKRGLAYGLDLLARASILALILFIAAISGLSAGDSLAHASMGVFLVVYFLLDWAYYVFFETLWDGRTPGKRAFRLRVVTDRGLPLRFGDSLLRNLLRAADFLPFGYAIGLVVMGRDRRFRRLGDLVAGTLVITEDRHAVGSQLRLEPPPTPQELRSLPQRLPLSGDEIDAIELFLRRSGRLSRRRQAELADLVAPIFSKRIGVRYKDEVRFLGLLHHRAREKGG